MTDPIVTVVWAAAVGAGATGVTAGFAKLFSLGTGQARIEQKLDDHISDETAKFERFANQLDLMDEKLPNGELRAILEKLVVMERKICGGRGLKPYKSKSTRRTR